MLRQTLERRQPGEVRELLQRGGMSKEQARAALDTLVGEGQVFVLGRPPGGEPPAPVPESAFVVTRSGWGALRERIEALLGDYHRRYPLRTGMPREEVKSRLGRFAQGLTPRLFNEVVQRAAEEGWLAQERGALRLTHHRVTFGPRQQQAVDALLHAFREAPYTTPSVSQCEAQVGEEVFNALVERGTLVQLSEDVVLLAETYDEMRDGVVAFIEAEGSVTVAQARDLFDTSRKYALALLGYLDEQRVTRRVGDERVLR